MNVFLFQINDRKHSINYVVSIVYCENLSLKCIYIYILYKYILQVCTQYVYIIHIRIILILYVLKTSIVTGDFM